MTPTEVLAWLGTLAVAVLVMILLYSFLKTLWTDLVVKPRARKRHEEAMRQFSAKLRGIAAKQGVVLPSDPYKGNGSLN